MGGLEKGMMMKTTSGSRRRSRGLMLLTATATMIGLLVTGAPTATAADSLAQQWVTDNPFGMFIHYGPGTYTNRQWSNEDHSNTGRSDFNPTQTVNTDQWAATIKSAGMTFGVLTAKHHDGFALWPTAYSTYDIAESPYQNGNGDIVRDYTNSMRAAGLKVGIYFSIWDEYNGDSTALVKNQLSELLQNYGTIDYLWFDGWGWKVPYPKINYDEVRNYIRSISPTTVVANNDHEKNPATTDVMIWEVPIDRFPARDARVKDTSDTLDFNDLWFSSTYSGPPKSAQTIVDAAASVNARNSLYLLNVGPGKDGMISAKYATRLAEIGALRARQNLTLEATATQSSIEFGGAANRAIDGNTSGDFTSNSVSHTGSGQYSWWDADLGAAAKVNSVQVYNRSSFGERLSDYWVMVSDRPFTTGLSPTAQAAQSWVWSSRQTTQAGTPTTIAIPGGKIGRYVRVQLAGTGYLALSEVKALGTRNLIADSTATQSSTAFGGDASRASDGNSTATFVSESVSHTDSEQYSWWDANLGTTTKVSSIEVYNRSSFGERLSDYWVMVSDKPFTAGLSPTAQAAQSGVWSSRQTTQAGTPTTVAIPGGKVGQYVRVQLAGTGYLALTEVKAFSAENLAVGKAATQSSTEFGGAASRANDSNTDGNYAANSISHTGSGQYSWWETNLGAAAKVFSVEIYNRTDTSAERLSDYWVMVSDQPFTAGLSPTAQAAQPGVWSSHQTTQAGSPTTVAIPGGKIGQYVRVQLAGTGTLALTEVKVLG
jgi:alpha-L-fucosidase